MGTELTHSNSTEFHSVKTKLLRQMEEALQKRFAEFSASSVVQATRIAHTPSWPKRWDDLRGLFSSVPSCFALFDIVLFDIFCLCVLFLRKKCTEMFQIS